MVRTIRFSEGLKYSIENCAAFHIDMGQSRLSEHPALRTRPRWRDAPAACGPHKTLYNRWKRWSDRGIFALMMAGLAAEHGEQKTVMIDATDLKAHDTATSLGRQKWEGVDA